MSFKKGVNPYTGEKWMSSGSLHERMAAPVNTDDTAKAVQRKTDQTIEQALSDSPVIETEDGLLIEQSATGGYVMSSRDSLRHRLAALNEAQAEAEALAIADHRNRFGV